MLETATAIILGIIGAGGAAAIVLIARGEDPDRDEAAAGQLLRGLADTDPGRGLPRATDVPAWSIADTITIEPVGGSHRALGWLAYEETATETAYKPRHGLDPEEGAEIPPSMVPALELMTPLERARELVRQLHQAHWHPWRHLPRLEAIRYVAATVAARNGVPLMLGQFRREVALP